MATEVDVRVYRVVNEMGNRYGLDERAREALTIVGQWAVNDGYQEGHDGATAVALVYLPEGMLDEFDQLLGLAGG